MADEADDILRQSYGDVTTADLLRNLYARQDVAKDD